jgi:hypothetical protein
VLGFEANWFFREQFLSAQVYSVQVKSVYDVPSRFGAEENDDETSVLRKGLAAKYCMTWSVCLKTPSTTQTGKGTCSFNAEPKR